MLARSLILLATISFITSASGFRQSESWTKFSSDEGRFSILLPGKVTSDSETNELFTTHSVTAETDWATYLVAYVDYKAALSPNREQILDGARDGLLTISKLVSERKITLNGYPGRELKLTSDGGQALDLTRLFVVGNRIYKVSTVFAPANKYDSAEAEKFFSSFKLTDSEAKKKIS
jgi:hypothetical protein